jgi:hypothetical protein
MSTEEIWKDDQPSMDHRRERIRDGYRSRVSDVLNASERDFITLTEATVEALEGGPRELHPFLTLARRHIVFVVAASETPEE